LLKTVKAALSAFSDKQKWAALAKKAMGLNFSWEASARKYLELYAKAGAKK
jgi:starch synthase